MNLTVNGLSGDRLDEVLQLAGLEGLDELGRLRLRKLASTRRRHSPYTGRHAELLNGLDDISDEELAGLGKKLKKALKKATKVVAKVAKVIPGAALILPSKAGIKNATTTLVTAGTAAASMMIPGAGSVISSVLGAKGAGAAAPDGASIEAEAERQASAIYAQQQLSVSDGSGAALTGQYLSKNEPDPQPMDTADQWIAGIENKWVLLGSAGVLSAVLLLSMRSRKAREGSN